jgi:hypothetical protein
MFQYTTVGSYSCVFMTKRQRRQDSHEQEEIIGADIFTERQEY